MTSHWPLSPRNRRRLPAGQGQVLLRVVRCLPIRAGVSGCAEADGQALEKPRGRKPRGEPGWLLQVTLLWGFESLPAGQT